MSVDASRGQKRASDHLELELQVACMNHLIWVIETGLGSFVGAAYNPD